MSNLLNQICLNCGLDIVETEDKDIYRPACKECEISVKITKLESDQKKLEECETALLRCYLYKYEADKIYLTVDGYFSYPVRKRRIKELPEYQ